MTSCSLPEIDAAIAEARFNPDNEERLEQYRAVERLVIETACGMTPTYHHADNFLIKPELVGFRENIAGQDAFLPGDWRAEAWGIAD